MGENMKNLVQTGKKILQKLNDSGYEAFFVGGYVRDQILGIKSDDIDITTNARPETIETLFEKTVPTGKKYGTITVILNGYNFEVTTYRVDHNYTNYRQPEKVEFSSELIEDLVRRDFTINALAMDISGSIVDYFQGQTDIDNQLIKAIQDPYKRFKEDALRILRAIRFVGKLGFTIEKDTMKAMIEDVHLLDQLPTERIIKELSLVLKQPKIRQVYKIIQDIHLGDVFIELSQGFRLLENTDLSISIEELFALSMYPNSQVNHEKWRFSKNQFSRIETILDLMNLLKNQTISPVDAYRFKEKDLLSADYLLTHFFNYTSQNELIKDTYNHLIIKNYNELLIKGEEIKDMVEHAKNIGMIIDKLIEEVLLDKIDNKKDVLLKRAKELAEEL